MHVNYQGKGKNNECVGAEARDVVQLVEYLLRILGSICSTS